MHIGLIGLGKMGFNMRERMRNGGIEVTGFDRNPDVTDVASVDELIAALPTPRLVWVMVPSGEITDAVVNELRGKLSEGDLVMWCFRRRLGTSERIWPDGRGFRKRHRTCHGGL